MKSTPKRHAYLTAVAAGLVGLLGACAGSGTSTVGHSPASQAQQITVGAREYALDVRSPRTLRPGFVRLTLRNDGRGEHGLELVRLRRALTTPALLAAFGDEKSRDLDALGGAPSVPPGHRWEMTTRLSAGDYALLDYGENAGKVNLERGMFKRFRVSGPPWDGATEPRTVGALALRDFRFDMHLPRHFSGHGTVAIPNRGHAFHEVSLVRIQRGHTQDEVLRLIKQGQGSPPPWATIVDLLGVLGPNRTAYVRFDLPPGRYVAMCLIDDPKSGRLHADLGMIRTFDVGGR